MQNIVLCITQYIASPIQGKTSGDRPTAEPQPIRIDGLPSNNPNKEKHEEQSVQDRYQVLRTLMATMILPLLPTERYSFILKNAKRIR